jgi:DNA-binding NtrC family response regulator
MVAEQTFRQDVYYRLCAITVVIPPLRDRRDDVPLLWQHFVAEEAAERGNDPPLIDPDVPMILMGLDWPGNVRQLRNVVRTAWALGGGRHIGRDELAMALGQPDLVHVVVTGGRLGGANAGTGDATVRHIHALAEAPSTPLAPPAPPAPGAPGMPSPYTSPPAPPDSSGALLQGLTTYEQRERDAILAALDQTGNRRVAAARLLGLSRRTFYRRLDKYGIDER